MLGLFKVVFCTASVAKEIEDEADTEQSLNNAAKTKWNEHSAGRAFPQRLHTVVVGTYRALACASALPVDNAQSILDRIMGLTVEDEDGSKAVPFVQPQAITEASEMLKAMFAFNTERVGR